MSNLDLLPRADLALAPDVEKLQGYVHLLLSVPVPSLEDPTAKFVLQNVVDTVTKAAFEVELFSASNLTTK